MSGLKVRLAPRKTGLSPPVKYFTDRSKAILLFWIFYVFYVLRLLCLCACLFICALWSPAGKGLTSWLSFVVSNCEFVTIPLVSWVRCGTWLYRFLGRQACIVWIGKGVEFSIMSTDFKFPCYNVPFISYKCDLKLLCIYKYFVIIEIICLLLCHLK